MNRNEKVIFDPLGWVIPCFVIEAVPEIKHICIFPIYRILRKGVALKFPLKGCLSGTEHTEQTAKNRFLQISYKKI